MHYAALTAGAGAAPGSDTQRPGETDAAEGSRRVVRVADAFGVREIALPPESRSIAIGTAPDAPIRLSHGNQYEAAILYSEGVPMVARVGAASCFLGTIEVRDVAVPVTRYSSKLHLPHASLDLAKLVVADVVPAVRPDGIETSDHVEVAQLNGATALAFGHDARRTADRVVECFPAAGVDAAYWALEAGAGSTSAPVVAAGCVRAERRVRLSLAIRAHDADLWTDGGTGLVKVSLKSQMPVQGPPVRTAVLPVDGPITVRVRISGAPADSPTTFTLHVTDPALGIPLSEEISAFALDAGGGERWEK